MEMVDPIVFRLTIFVLAIFVGYFVVWSVTPALHTPLMAVTNAISSVIVVGALIAVSVDAYHPPQNVEFAVDANGNTTMNGKKFADASTPEPKIVQMIQSISMTPPSNSKIQSAWTSKILGLFALILASVNIFGGFLVTQRMLAMYKKKEGK